MTKIYFDDPNHISALKSKLSKLPLADKEAEIGNRVGTEPLARAALLNNAEPQLNQLATEISLRQRVRYDYDKPFEALLHQELINNRRRFQDMRTQLERLGHTAIDPDQLFIEMGIGTGRVMLSAPIVVPYHHAPGFNYDASIDQKLELITAGQDVITDGFHYNLGWFQSDVLDATKRTRSCYIPALFVDAVIMTTIRNLQKSQDRATKTAASFVLPEMQDLFSVSIHDYKHHMYWPLNLSKNPRLTFLAPDAPLKKYKAQNVYKSLSDHNKFHDPKLARVTTTPLEFQAELFNRDLWRETFRKYPWLKKNLIRTATTYMVDLETIHGALKDQHSETFADSFVKYMTPITASRFLRIIDVDDPALFQPIRLHPSRGRNISFYEACQKLSLAPLSLDFERSKNWVLASQLPRLKGKTERKLSRIWEVFANNSQHFPHLGMINQRAKDEVTLLTGFENMVARSFFEGGPRMTRVPIMYDFVENDPRYNQIWCMSRFSAWPDQAANF